MGVKQVISGPSALIPLSHHVELADGALRLKGAAEFYKMRTGEPEGCRKGLSTPQRAAGYDRGEVKSAPRGHPEDKGGIKPASPGLGHHYCQIPFLGRPAKIRGAMPPPLYSWLQTAHLEGLPRFFALGLLSLLLRSAILASLTFRKLDIFFSKESLPSSGGGAL